MANLRNYERSKLLGVNLENVISNINCFEHKSIIWKMKTQLRKKATGNSVYLLHLATNLVNNFPIFQINKIYNP